MQILKYDIRFSTFFKKGIKVKEDPWGVYMVTGFQGSGKTYFSVFLINSMLNDYTLYTNIKSLKLSERPINYFETLEEIVSNTDENCIFLIDEISKRFTKSSQQDKWFYSWLQQSRKRGRIVILITQEWKEVPTWLRRPVRFMYTTHKIGFSPFFLTTMGDALNCTFNTETNDWECPVIKRIIYKRNKFIASLYDTFEPIDKL